MAAMTELVITFICFAIVWWRWRVCMHTHRMVVLRRRLHAFYDCEEDDLREIVHNYRYSVDQFGLGTEAKPLQISLHLGMIWSGK